MPPPSPPGPIKAAMEALRQARIALYVLTSALENARLRRHTPPMPLPALLLAIVAARNVIAAKKLAVLAVGGP